MAWNNMYRPDYEYAKIVGAANPIEPVAKYVNVLKDEHVANTRYAQEWEAKKEAAKKEAELKDSQISDNKSKVTDRDAKTQPTVNKLNTDVEVGNTQIAINKVKPAEITANTEHKKEQTLTEKETRQPKVNKLNTGVELDNNQIAESQLKQTWYPKVQKATIDNKYMTGEAAKSNAAAQHGKVSAMYADVKRKTANDKMNYDISTGKLKLDVEKLGVEKYKSLTAPTIEEKKELKQTPAGKTAGKYENPIRGL